jgi:cellulose synthase (UDP-forming)
MLRGAWDRLMRSVNQRVPQDQRPWWQRVFVRPALPADAGQVRPSRVRTERAPGMVEAAVGRLGIDVERLGARLECWADQGWLRSSPVRWLLVALAVFLLWATVTTPLDWPAQLALFFILWLVALVIRHIPGHLPTLLLIALSMGASTRYGYWRVTQSLNLEPGWETVLGWTLLGAEVYAWLIMVLGFVQSIWPLKRPTLPMPEDRSTWPTVDVFIPTYHEPLSVVEPTVLAALGMDWPREKLNIYLLDDGRRDEFHDFAQAAGVHYVRRTDNVGAKAGNLNHALSHSNGEFIAFFDCDHMPVRTFLTNTMGWMLHEPRCAMVQTPQHFFSPDPFERNLDTFRRVPNEGKLFYGIVQDGNDFWNAAFFCGSCAVVRRAPLEEIGGVAMDTVTEDAHTALKLHRKGYTTAYVNVTQAAGLATESLSQHIAQRTRWARGMAQIFRIDNPLFGRGLTFMQRLCYSNAMLHFFYGIPRLVFLTAPLAYLFFEQHIINAAAPIILVYALPHVVLPHITNAHINGPHRHTFWAEVYETVLAWYVALPTTLAFLNPRLGQFNVTVKGGLIEQEHFDWRISRPYLLLVLLNVLGFGFGLVRLFSWNTYEASTVLLNLVWTAYNLAMLGAALGVARERRQIRLAHRVTARLPVCLVLSDGTTYVTHTQDYSLRGIGVMLNQAPHMEIGDSVQIVLGTGDEEHAFPMRVQSVRGDHAGLAFEPLTMQQRKLLVQCTLARPDAWAQWPHRYEEDHAIQGLQEIVLLAVQSYSVLLRLYTSSLTGFVRDRLARRLSREGMVMRVRGKRIS